MEKDAENFACDFIRAIAKEIYEDPNDIKMCLDTCKEYDRVMGIVKGDSANLVNFGKIYELNIEDYYKQNEEIFCDFGGCGTRDAYF